MAQAFGRQHGHRDGDGLVARAAHLLAGESDRWALWGPVLFGIGIGAYFSLGQEPTAALAVTLLLSTAAALVLVRPWPLAMLFAAGALCAALGFADAKLRASWVASPVLTQTLGGVVVTGWVERVERRQPRGFRLTIRVHSVERLAADRTPYRVRVTTQAAPPPATGEAVMLRAVLRPPPEPVEPGGFDFARSAWFARLGAVGFAIAAPQEAHGIPRPPLDLRFKGEVDALRRAVEHRIETALPGGPGALAIALITGERGGIPEDVLTALRQSGLAHVLAISGLHMALMAGALYWLMRALLAAVPAIALRFAIKKWAACLALAGGAFYLALSGAAIATQRAFIMMAVLFIAILLERPALTLRNVALAAWIILAAFPETLFDVSFQMSFAAVVALVAFYEEASRRLAPVPSQALWSALLTRFWRYMAGIAMTTLVASLAIAPYAAYHFHTIAQYSLIANMLAMPVVGLVIMPMALATLIAMPLGLEAWPLAVMSWGIDRLVAVARMVSGWDGAVIHVPEMAPASLLLLTLGGLWLALWRQRWRLAGIVIAGMGVLAASGGQRPDLLIAREGELYAVRDADGRLAASSARPAYSLERWLLADGDGRRPAEAAGAGVLRCDRLACVSTVKGKTLAIVHHPAALAEECERADIVIVETAFRGPCRKARVLIDRIEIWAGGAHALYLGGQSIRVETVADVRGDRPWVSLRQRREPRSPRGSALASESSR